MSENNIDTIRIELVVVASTGLSDVFMQGSLEIYINQKKPYDESSDIIDFENLLESMAQDGEYYIFSCCCGIPQCSGWEKGIQVNHSEHHVIWTNENTHENWTFDKNWIRQELITVKEEAAFYKNFFEKKGINYVGIGYK